MILDIDHFKQVNDTYGHDAGDRIASAVSPTRVKRVVRGADLMCRLGGEEFVVVMPDTNLATAQIVGERIRAAVAGNPFPLDNGDQSIRITVSIGVTDLPGAELPTSLLKRADQALYRSKNGGRNRVTVAAA